MTDGTRSPALPAPTSRPSPTSGEWLLTNGLGGYALGPRTGPPTRGYHGWLVAAAAPPDGRLLLVGAMETLLSVDGVIHRLDALDLAATTATAGGVAIELEAAMVRDANATVLRWRRTDATAAVATLRVTPRVAGRDHHPGSGPVVAPSSVTLDVDGRAATVEWPTAPTLGIATEAGHLHEDRRSADVTYPEEVARGTAQQETLHAAVTLEATLAPGEAVVLVLSTVTGSIGAIPSPADAGGVFEAAARHRAGLLRQADIAGDPRLAALVIAADHFVVRRLDAGLADPADGRTIIAGYPWFGDWGRDTAISLPGLALATGRHDVAASILRTWSGLVRDGLLPNHFPDAGGTGAYHAIDAPLWFVHALGAHEAATGDPTLAAAVRHAVEQIVTAYRDGTRFGIGMDPSDGLVRGGAPGLQLTWMDAKVDGVVITPRHGKPIEIQALWIHALRLAAGWADASGDPGAAAGHRELAARAAVAVRARFVDRERGWLRDVVDGPDGDDSSLRPNQLLALGLVPDLVEAADAASALDACGTHLVVPGGVRTLAPFEPGYRPSFQGPPAVRDAAYHQGPAWTWLLGAWIDAVGVHRGREAARFELRRALDALDPDHTGAIPELLEPEPPHASRGCPWQAWGVAELLRCGLDLAR